MSGRDRKGEGKGDPAATTLLLGECEWDKKAETRVKICARKKKESMVSISGGVCMDKGDEQV